MKNTNNTLAAIQLSQVIEQLKQDDSNLLQAYSEYVSNNDFDSVFYNDDENINAVFFADTHDALRSAFYGDYNPSHAYFTFNGYGNLQSFEYLDSDNSPIDASELAEWLISEDKLAEYDITVTTLDDMLASIEDNISDDKRMLDKLICYLGLSIMLDDSYKISEALNELIEKDYNQLKEIVTHLGINYQ